MRRSLRGQAHASESGHARCAHSSRTHAGAPSASRNSTQGSPSSSNGTAAPRPSLALNAAGNQNSRSRAGGSRLECRPRLRASGPPRRRRGAGAGAGAGAFGARSSARTGASARSAAAAAPAPGRGATLHAAKPAAAASRPPRLAIVSARRSSEAATCVARGRGVWRALGVCGGAHVRHAQLPIPPGPLETAQGAAHSGRTGGGRGAGTHLSLRACELLLQLLDPAAQLALHPPARQRVKRGHDLDSAPRARQRGGGGPPGQRQAAGASDKSHLRVRVLHAAQRREQVQAGVILDKS